MRNDMITLLNDFACIAVIGEKAESFLQGQLTCDVREITDTQTRRAAHCTPKGRVLSFMRVFKLAGKFYLWLPQNMVDATIKELKKYAMLSRVSLEKATNMTALGCYGEEIRKQLLVEFGKLPEQADTAILLDPADKPRDDVAGSNLIVIAVQGDAPRYEIIGECTALETLQQKLARRPAACPQDPAMQSSAWKLLNIQAGIAQIYPATADMFTPHMLNYPALNAVNFKKGCYIGQEIIARTHYLGKAKRHLYSAVLPTSVLPNPGEIIYNNNQQEAGIVIDAAIENDKCYLLAVLQDEMLTEQLKLKEINFAVNNCYT